MITCQLLFTLFLLLTFLSHISSTQYSILEDFFFDSPFHRAFTYRAAVVEHIPTFKNTLVHETEALQIMTTNLNKYESHMKAAKQQNVQIIVFPEDGLYGDLGGSTGDPTRAKIYPYLENIPQVNSTITVNPCNDIGYEDRPILKKASCLAKTLA